MNESKMLMAARHARNEQARVCSDMAARALDPDVTASGRRTLDKGLVSANLELSRRDEEVDRLEAIEAARAQVPVDARVFDGGGTGAIDGSLWATPLGSLYSERQYRPDHGPSFFRDVVLSREDPSAQERLARNQREGLDRLASRPEFRGDVSTTSNPGLGGIIPPVWLADQWAAAPRASRPFADAIGSRPLTEFGMTLSVPKLTVGGAVGSQAVEADAVTEQDPDTDTVDAPVVTIAGQVDVSRQALERSLPQADVVIFGDLMQAYDAELDRQLIDGLGSGGEMKGILHMSADTITYTSSTPAAGSILRKIFDAIQTLASSRFLPPEVILLHPRRAADLASSLSDEQPLFPLGSASARALGTSNAGFTNDVAGLRTILDPNVPTDRGAGTNQDVIAVLRASDLLLYEQPVRQLRLEQVLSGTLQVRLQVYSYAAFIPNRWVQSVELVEGTGLTPPVFV